MLKSSSEKAVAVIAFIASLCGSLAGFPLLFDTPAFAVADREGDRDNGGIEARLAGIASALSLTDSQMPQWNALAAVMRRQAKDQEALLAVPRDRAVTAIDRLELRQKALAELLAAARPLYLTLSDDQRRTADELLTPHLAALGGADRG